MSSGRNYLERATHDDVRLNSMLQAACVRATKSISERETPRSWSSRLLRRESSRTVSR